LNLQTRLFHLNRLSHLRLMYPHFLNYHLMPMFLMNLLFLKSLKTL
jgi:hypothetical protein